MSGPKNSSYRVTEAMRRQMEEEQRRREAARLEEARLREEKAEAGRLFSAIGSALAGADDKMPRVRQLLQESGFDTAKADATESAILKEKEKLGELRHLSPSNSTDMKAVNGQLRQLLESARESARQVTEYVPALEKSFRDKLSDVIRQGESISFSGIGREEKKEDPEAAQAREKILGILEKCGESAPSPLRAEIGSIREKAQAIGDAAYLKNMMAVVVMPFEKRCTECAAYDDEKARYEMLAGDARVAAKEFDCTPQGICDMRAAADALEKAIVDERERAYVNQALDEVMRGMGYKLVGDRVAVKRTGYRVKHDLYSLREGRVVDVTYHENGQISMELGAVGHADRLPTAEESECLVEDMRSFCGDYRLLAQKLAERGIVSSCISHLPPDAAYAQVFNVNDYDLTRPMEEYRAEETRAATGKKERHLE